MTILRSSPAPATSTDRGFVRYDLYLAAAFLLLALAVVVPQAVKHGFLRALLALVLMVAAVAVLVAVLIAITWLVEAAGRPARGGWGRVSRWLGHVLRFGLFGFIGAVLGAGLCALHDLPSTTQNLIALTTALLGGGLGCLAYHRLGPARFWPTFGMFCLTLLGSFLGGILGILGPGNWGVTIGILVPLVVFAILLARGRTVPPREASSPPAV